MDSRHRRRSSSDRFMTALKLIPPSSTDGGDELSEHDVFFTGANLHNPPSTSSTAPPPPSVLHHRRHHKSYHPESFGILAALPESGDECRSVLNSPPPPPSSSRMIPTLPRRSMERKIFSLPEKYHQSAPMNVPPRPLAKDIRGRELFEDGNDGVLIDYDDDGEMLPPHEIVARQMSKSPVLSSSVLEGAGRTLKGRDLRQVRNAVFRQTGFID